MVVPVAVDAGLGELSRAGYLLNRDFGLNLRLSCVTTDMPLEHDPPVDLGIQDFCGKCLKCAVNCPAGAIPTGKKTVTRGVRKWQMDPEKCLLYWSRSGSACTICQVVCPWTKKPGPLHRTVSWMAVNLPWIRRMLVGGDDILFGKSVKPKSPPPWLPA
jgi:epoxyqueuosine reductase QueG